MVRPARGARTQEGSALHHPSKGRGAPAKKKCTDRILDALFRHAHRRGWFRRRGSGSIDATGLESRYISRYFLTRQDRRCKRTRPFIKISIVCHHETHLMAAVVVRQGPCNDAADFQETLQQAGRRLQLDTFMGDAAYDAESHHQQARAELGARQTIVPINPRGHNTSPQTKYRKRMYENFPRASFGQRWQTESAFSQLKRLLESHLRAHSNEGRFCEATLRIITFNLMLLLCALAQVFYKAGSWFMVRGSWFLGSES